VEGKKKDEKVSTPGGRRIGKQLIQLQKDVWRLVYSVNGSRRNRGSVRLKAAATTTTAPPPLLLAGVKKICKN
jgi:hypothetical protein